MTASSWTTTTITAREPVGTAPGGGRRQRPPAVGANEAASCLTAMTTRKNWRRREANGGDEPPEARRGENSTDSAAKTRLVLVHAHVCCGKDVDQVLFDRHAFLEEFFSSWGCATCQNTCDFDAVEVYHSLNFSWTRFVSRKHQSIASNYGLPNRFQSFSNKFHQYVLQKSGCRSVVGFRETCWTCEHV